MTTTAKLSSSSRETCSGFDIETHIGMKIAPLYGNTLQTLPKSADDAVYPIKVIVKKTTLSTTLN